MFKTWWNVIQCVCSISLSCLSNFPARFYPSVCVFSHLYLSLSYWPLYTLPFPCIRYLLHSFCIKLFQLFFVCLSDVFDLKCVLRGASAITHEVFIIHKEARPGLFMVYKPLRLRLRGLYTYNNLRLRLRSLYKIIHLASLGGIIYW